MNFLSVAYYPILGKNPIFYTGLIAFVTFTLATLIPILKKPFKYHLFLVRIAFVFAFIHAFLAIAVSL